MCIHLLYTVFLGHEVGRLNIRARRNQDKQNFTTMMISIVLFALLYTSAFATVVHETMDFAAFQEPAGWRDAGDADRATPHQLTFKFQLSELRREALYSALYSVSHPDSPQYGKHW